MPRNEFMLGAAERSDCLHCGDSILKINDKWTHLSSGIAPCSPFKPVFAEPQNHSGKSDDEVTDQEVDPIEDDPHMWPARGLPTLAELRKSGESTTAAHFAGPAT